MNIPPLEHIRVSHQALQNFVRDVGLAVGMPAEQAALLAELLTLNDLRGVFSHGTRQILGYARQMRQGQINPAPEVHVIDETPTSLLIDGDGGLGYFPAYQGTLALIPKAVTQGISALVTRNHGHIGAAGIYARLPLKHDLLTFVTSGHQLDLTPGEPLQQAAGGSPMSFTTPADEEADIVVDLATMGDLYVGAPFAQEIARHAPGLMLRSIGLGAICQTWGGFLAGVPLDPARAHRRFAGANQGALVITWRIDLFMDPRAFKREVDAYVRAASALTPLPGFDRAYLAGGVEAAREAVYRQEGIPVGREHQQELEACAAELGLRPPWPAG